MAGGEDNILHFWDLRQFNQHKTIFGVELAGDTLDYMNGKILTGCRTTSNQIKIWNPNSYHMINQINLNYVSDFPNYVSTAKYCHQTPGILAAGTSS